MGGPNEVEEAVSSGRPGWRWIKAEDKETKSRKSKRRGDKAVIPPQASKEGTSHFQIFSEKLMHRCPINAYHDSALAPALFLICF